VGTLGAQASLLPLTANGYLRSRAIITQARMPALLEEPVGIILRSNEYSFVLIAEKLPPYVKAAGLAKGETNEFVTT